MIYNFAQYLKNQFSTETFYTNEKARILTNTDIPDRICILTESSGGVEALNFWTNRKVQIYCRDIDPVKARAFIFGIYEYVGNNNGCVLPEVVVDLVTYPEITTGQMIADQTPSHINVDEQGRSEFIFNLTIQFKEV